MQACLLLVSVALAQFSTYGTAPEPLGIPNLGPEVPFVATPQETVEAMLALAGVGAGDVVYDLGSGDGRIVITAARKYGARGVGIEIDAALVQDAREAARAAGVEGRVEFRQVDLFAADLHDATVVTLYLLQSVNLRLRPKLLSELKPGTRVVSRAFHMGDWKPEKVVHVGSTPLYLWRVPERTGAPR